MARIVVDCPECKKEVELMFASAQYPKADGKKETSLAPISGCTEKCTCCSSNVGAKIENGNLVIYIL